MELTEEQRRYQSYLAMPHDELARLATQMNLAGQKLEEDYKVLYSTCEKKMETMSLQAEQAVTETVRYALVQYISLIS